MTLIYAQLQPKRLPWFFFSSEVMIYEWKLTVTCTCKESRKTHTYAFCLNFTSLSFEYEWGGTIHFYFYCNFITYCKCNEIWQIFKNLYRRLYILFLHRLHFQTCLFFCKRVFRKLMKLFNEIVKDFKPLNILHHWCCLITIANNLDTWLKTMDAIPLLWADIFSLV